MPVKHVRSMGWTNAADTANFWAAMEDDWRKRRGEEIVAFRKAKGWSAERLARESGLSSKTISRLETGAVDEPHGDTLDKLVAALGVNSIGPPRPTPVEAERAGDQLDRILAVVEDGASAAALADLARRLQVIERQLQAAPKRRKRPAADGPGAGRG